MGIDFWSPESPRFGHLFEDIEREFAEAEDMLNRMFRTIGERGPSAAASTIIESILLWVPIDCRP